MKIRFLNNRSGQAAAEMALALPVIMLLITGTLTFGLMIYSKTLVVLASSQGAKVGSYSYGEYLNGTITYNEFTEKVRNTSKYFINNGITGGNSTVVDVVISDDECEITVKVKYDFTFILPLLGDILGGKTVIPLEYKSTYVIQ